MSVIEIVGPGLALLFLIVAVIRIFSAPLKLALRLGFNAALGFAAMWVVNLTTAYTGLHLGLSWFNGLVVGVLGIPGFLLLLLVKWVVE